VLYHELADIACSAYGFHGGALGKGFGRLSTLPEREYRLTGRPFMPYLRDAEFGVAIDPERNEVLGRVSEYRRCIEPREERWLTYACLIQGAKGILHWNYGSGISKPPNWISKKQTIIRAGMGGALEHDPHGYRLPDAITRDLRAAWDEIGRINLELRAIGPLVANSDVSALARVVASTPERSTNGEPAVEAAALISGLDTIVLIVLNQTIQTNWTGAADHGIEAYPPADATVALDVPPWLEPRDVFSVRHSGVATVDPKREAGQLLFSFDGLAVSEVVVITERPGLQASVRDVLAKLSGESSRP